MLVHVYMPLYWLGGGTFLFHRTPAFCGKSRSNTSFLASVLEPGSSFDNRGPEQVGIVQSDSKIILRMTKEKKLKIENFFPVHGESLMDR